MTARAAARRRDERPKSLITLWMNGGMSQLETWDPHPGTKSGGEVRDIATSNKDCPHFRIAAADGRATALVHVDSFADFEGR